MSVRLKIHIGLLTAITITCLFHACNKSDEERIFPEVETLEVTNITDEGALLRAKIAYVSSSGILDHGFYYGLSDEELSDYEKMSLGEYTGGNSQFECQISRNLVKDEVYNAVAYVQTETHLVYGVATSFVSKGGKSPFISSFRPTIAGWGDTISVCGSFFASNIQDNNVKFDSYEASIISASDTLLKVTVPETLVSYKSSISVTTSEKTIIADEQFQIAPPVIISLSDTVSYGGVLTIVARNINSEVTNFYIDGNPVAYSQFNKNNVEIKVPLTYQYGQHTLKISVFDNSDEDTFHYEAPVITDIEPQLVTWGNTIKIKGKNLSYIGSSSNSSLQFIDSNCSSYALTIVNDSLVQTSIPVCVRKNECSVQIATKYLEILSPTTIKLRPPELLSFNQDKVTVGETIILEGRYIRNTETRCYVDDVLININLSFVDSTHLNVPIPSNLDAGKHNVKLTIGELTSNLLDFEVQKLQLTSFAEKYNCRAGTLTINGENFASLYYYNTVYIDNIKAKIVSVSESSLQVEIPDDIDISSSPEVVVCVGAQKATVPDQFTMIEPWEKVSELNVGFVAGAKFSIGNNLYISTGNTSDGEFYCFNTDNNTWKEIAAYPGGRVMVPICFVVEGKAYVGLGDKSEPQKFWSYDPDTDSWTEIADCPLSVYTSGWEYNRNYGFGFGIDQTGYVGNSSGSVYEYSVADDKWTTGKGFKNVYSYNKWCGFGGKDKGYVYAGNYARFYKYDKTNNSWESKYVSYYASKNSSYELAYDQTRNKIFYNGYIEHSVFDGGIYYRNLETDTNGFLFPSIGGSNIMLFSTEDGRLFLMTDHSLSGQLITYEFNFDKYEQIKDLLNVQ